MTVVRRARQDYVFLSTSALFGVSVAVATFLFVVGPSHGNPLEVDSASQQLPRKLKEPESVRRVSTGGLFPDVYQTSVQRTYFMILYTVTEC